MSLKSRKQFMKVLAGSLLTVMLANCGGGGGSISVLPSQNTHEQERAQSKDIDILFVIDDSGSMKPVQDNLKANFGAFIEAFAEQGFSFRVAVAKTSAYGTPSSPQTSGGNTYYEAGRTVAEFRCGHGNNCGAGPHDWMRGCTGGYGDTPTTNGNGTLGAATDHILDSSDFISDPENPTPAELEAFATKFSRNADVGLCGSGDERAFQSAETVLRAMNALGGTISKYQFPRPNAHFAVIHVGDEPDGKWSSASSSNANGSLNAHNFPEEEIPKAAQGNTEQNRNVVKAYLDALGLHTPSATVPVHAIQNLTSACDPASQIGHPQNYMADIALGKKISICDDFATELADLGDHIVSLASEFYLNSVDVIESTLKVWVNGVEVVRSFDNGLDGGVYVLLNTPYRIQFLPGHVPPEGAIIKVEFTGRYLRDPIL